MFAPDWNATIDDTIRYADAAGNIFRSFPDTRFTFQLTFPDSGFGGMVLKPWGVRKTPTAAYLPQIQMKLGAIPGIQMFPVMPSALPGAESYLSDASSRSRTDATLVQSYRSRASVANSFL